MVLCPTTYSGPNLLGNRSISQIFWNMWFLEASIPWPPSARVSAVLFLTRTVWPHPQNFDFAEPPEIPNNVISNKLFFYSLEIIWKKNFDYDLSTNIIRYESVDRIWVGACVSLRLAMPMICKCPSTLQFIQFSKIKIWISPSKWSLRSATCKRRSNIRSVSM